MTILHVLHNEHIPRTDQAKEQAAASGFSASLHRPCHGDSLVLPPVVGPLSQVPITASRGQQIYGSASGGVPRLLSLLTREP